MESQANFSTCCLKSFAWDGTPRGHETTLFDNQAYVIGDNPRAAVLYVHDALGWSFNNARLLADHFAREANVTVYLPDFFGGEALDQKALLEGRWEDLDLTGFKHRNSRSIREPEIFACARALRDQGFSKIGAIGYCFGGWAVLRLASNAPLVDAVVCAHPSWVTKEDFEDISVPIQLLAPENDSQFTPEMKLYAFQKLVLEKKSVAVEWVHFPGVEHGCLTKGDEKTAGGRDAMIKGKDSAVSWFRQYLTE